MTDCCVNRNVPFVSQLIIILFV